MEVHLWLEQVGTFLQNYNSSLVAAYRHYHYYSLHNYAGVIIGFTKYSSKLQVLIDMTIDKEEVAMVTGR